MIQKRSIFLLLVIVLFICHYSVSPSKAKNIILMVPDGMAISNVNAARIYKFGTNKERLYFEKLDQIGYQSTSSLKNMITDSAAAASAWACGEKFVNGEISFHKDTNRKPQTILEIAKELGKSTGLVATSSVTHATPAAFGAHVKNRREHGNIARQYVTENLVNVLLGAGKKYFLAEKDYIKIAENNGYRVVFTKDAMNKVEGGGRLLGLFEKKALTPVFKKKYVKSAKSEPTLAEMTKKALFLLEKNEKGFFILVEGSQIDWANHRNSLKYQIGEILAFDDAVKTVIDWINQNPLREKNTLLIVVSDHGCGGFAIKGPKKPIKKPGQLVKAGWISKSHTGEDTMIWSQGPYSEHLGRAIDNTDIFHIMKAALLGQPYQRK